MTIVQHLRLDYCENFKLAWKETIDKLSGIGIRVFKNNVIILVNIGRAGH